MHQAAARELRNNTRALLQQVEAGESVTITVSGRPVAELRPIARQPSWISREEFVRRFAGGQADSGLASDLEQLTGGETTDDIPW